MAGVVALGVMSGGGANAVTAPNSNPGSAEHIMTGSDAVPLEQIVRAPEDTLALHLRAIAPAGTGTSTVGKPSNVSDAATGTGYRVLWTSDTAGLQADIHGTGKRLNYISVEFPAPTHTCRAQDDNAALYDVNLGQHTYGVNAQVAVQVGGTGWCEGGQQQPTYFWASLIPANHLDFEWGEFKDLTDVQPGDDMVITLRIVGYKWIFEARDNSIHRTDTIITTCPQSGGCPTPQGNIAVQAPGGNNFDNPSNFHEVVFQHAIAGNTCDGNAPTCGHRGFIGSQQWWTVDQLDMGVNGHVCVTPGGVNSRAEDFTDIFYGFGC